jgi:hypothetical protein
MSYAIFVRKPAAGRHATELLAYDFEHEDAAREAARNIATSYSEHGYNPSSEHYWFRSGSGLLEIFVWPNR